MRTIMTIAVICGLTIVKADITLGAMMMIAIFGGLLYICANPPT